ncbi:hypothetical protein SCHPADRAFT_998571 [Schizopora paradoxa]|uniref:Uncharacterized protein n=1 Tax=Schizopora paradoxa TaxID=27342 RepID=A0A0H2S4L5_9AGAM|nr:hypothetical protein SCHPADRAFT_998571 [Schizopora paradoxa]
MMPLRSLFGNEKGKESGACPGPSKDTLASLTITRVETKSSIDSDATAPNLEGPGRTVGLMYDFMGARLEDILNNLSKGRVASPEAVALCIRSLADACYQRETTPEESSKSRNPSFVSDRQQLELPFIEPSRAPTKEETKKLTKLCARLYKLTRTQVMSNQLEALREITDLAISYPILREILAHRRFNRYFQPKYKEHDVIFATARMHNSVKLSMTHEFWSCFSTCWMQNERIHYDPNALMLRAMKQREFILRFRSLVRDLDISFIMGRYLTRMMVSRMFFSFPDIRTLIFKEYVTFASANPREIEWGNIPESMKHNYFPFTMLTTRIVCSPEAAVQTSAFYYQLIRHMPGYMFANLPISRIDVPPIFESSQYKHSVLTTSFVEGFLGSDKIYIQLSRLHSLDQETKDRLKGTILADESLLAYYHLIRNCAASGDSLFSLDMPDMHHGIEVIARHVVHGSKKDQILAKSIASSVSQIHRYFKYEMEFAMDYLTNGTGELGWSPNPRPQKMPGGFIHFPHDNLPSRLEFFRLVSKGKHHFPDQSPRGTHCLYGTRAINRNVQSLKMNAVVQRMTINTNQVCFFAWDDPWPIPEHQWDATGHYPVLAEVDDQGERKYIAKVTEKCPIEDHPSCLLSFVFTTIKDGAKTVTYIDCVGKTRTTHEFSVMILRHDPSDAPPPYPSVPKNSLDPTGPLYWVPAEDDIKDEDGGGEDTEVEDARCTSAELPSIFPIWDLISDTSRHRDEDVGLAGAGVERNVVNKDLLHSSHLSEIGTTEESARSMSNDIDDSNLISRDDNMPTRSTPDGGNVEALTRRVRELENLLSVKEEELQSRRLKEESLTYWDVVRSYKGRDIE